MTSPRHPHTARTACIRLAADAFDREYSGDPNFMTPNVCSYVGKVVGRFVVYGEYSWGPAWLGDGTLYALTVLAADADGELFRCPDLSGPARKKASLTEAWEAIREPSLMAAYANHLRARNAGAPAGEE